MDETTLEPWQHEFLDSLNDLPGFTRDQTRSVMAVMCFGSSNTPAMKDAMRAVIGNGGVDGWIRAISAGMNVGEAITLIRARKKSGDATLRTEPQSQELPDMTFLAGFATEAMQLPDIGRLHAYAQAALLEAIRRKADVVEDVNDLRTLADAYLALPSPAEDGF